MLNNIWSYFLIIAFIYGILNGKVEELNNSIFSSTKEAVTLTLSLLGNVCLWSGIIKIFSNTTAIKKINKLINPIINKIFPDIKNNKIKNEISMNIIANMLGLGNAATPLGLKAIKSMQKENKGKNKLSNSMAMFIIINSISVQIIPTTVIAIRNSLNSNNSTKIILPTLIATIGADITTIILAKFFMKKN